MKQHQIRQMLHTCRQQAEQLRQLSRSANLRESGEIGMSGDVLLNIAVMIESLSNANEKALAGIERLDRSETQLIVERDAAQETLSAIYEVVIGHPPEWSNAFTFTDAIDEVTQCLHQRREPENGQET